jgi:hypothetical protein
MRQAQVTASAATGCGADAQRRSGLQVPAFSEVLPEGRLDDLREGVGASCVLT